MLAMNFVTDRGMVAGHASLSFERICEAARRQISTLDDPGFCLACGHEATGCEPDACEYECDNCGESKVYGASELVIMAIHP